MVYGGNSQPYFVGKFVCQKETIYEINNPTNYTTYINPKNTAENYDDFYNDPHFSVHFQHLLEVI